MSFFYYDSNIEKEILEEGKVTRKIKAHDGSLMIVEVYFENGAIGYTHKHENEQCTYCLEGEFEFSIGDEIKIIKKGDSVYMPPNLEHGCKLLSEKGRVLDIFTPQRLDFLK